MAVKLPTLYLLCGSASAAKAALVESIAVDDTLGDQSIIDRYRDNAKGAGMAVEVLLHPQNS